MNTDLLPHPACQLLSNKNVEANKIENEMEKKLHINIERKA